MGPSQRESDLIDSIMPTAQTAEAEPHPLIPPELRAHFLSGNALQCIVGTWGEGRCTQPMGGGSNSITFDELLSLMG